MKPLKILTFRVTEWLPAGIEQMGGRAAEQCIYGQENITTGASADLESATRTAKNAITKYGLFAQ